MLSVTLDGTDLNAAESTNGVGVWLAPQPEGVQGWFDSPDRRTGFEDIPNQDGQFDAPTYASGRVITFTGHASGGFSDLKAARRLLKSLAIGRNLSLLQVVDPVHGDGQTNVRASGPVNFDMWPNLQGADWQFSVTAPDPRIYGTALQSVSTARFVPGGGFTPPLTFPLTFGPGGTSGFVAVANNGTTDTWPVLLFDGPLVNPVAQLVGGGRIAPLMSIAAGDRLTVDLKARTATLGGQSRRAMLSVDSTFWSLPTGPSTIYFAADSGSGLLTVQWRDAEF